MAEGFHCRGLKSHGAAIFPYDAPVAALGKSDVESGGVPAKDVEHRFPASSFETPALALSEIALRVSRGMRPRPIKYTKYQNKAILNGLGIKRTRSE